MNKERCWICPLCPIPKALLEGKPTVCQEYEVGRIERSLNNKQEERKKDEELARK